MRAQLESRIDELRAEFEAGQLKLTALENETQQLRQTLLRISGAVQVLEEELNKAGNENLHEGTDGPYPGGAATFEDAGG